jgi:uncharacterized DUF497 family protein
VNFEWDSKKARDNQTKHGVGIEEAAAVLADEHSSTAADPDHAHDEERFLIFGLTERRGPSSSRLQSVVVEFGSSAAREMTRQERKAHEQQRERT